MSNYKRDYIVDILKFISLIFVIITHYNFTDNERLVYGFPFYIKCAVPIFMILSGYTLSMSYERRNIDTLNKSYDKKYLINRVIKFLIPCIFIVILQIAFRYIFMKDEFSIRDSIYSFISGGYGKGSYYNALIIQLIFIFPLIYFLIKKKGIYGLIICFFLNLLYEIIQTSYFMNESFYRLIVLRYIFLISSGSYMYLSKNKFKPYIHIISLLIGVLYICLVDYTNYKPLFITKWTDTSLFFGFYIIPIIYLIIKAKRKNINFKFFRLISESSYDIFLIQMLFYYVVDNLEITFGNVIIDILVMTVSSFLIGIIFHKFENVVVSKILNIITKIKIKKENKIENILLDC